MRFYDKIAFAGLMVLFTIISKSSTKTDVKMVNVLRAIDHLFNHDHHFTNIIVFDEIRKEGNSTFFDILLNILHLAYKII